MLPIRLIIIFRIELFLKVDSCTITSFVGPDDLVNFLQQLISAP